MSRVDSGDLMIDVTVERNVCCGGTGLVASDLGGVKRPFLAAMTEYQVAAFMGRREDENQGSEHSVTSRSILVRLKERSLAWKGGIY